MAQPASVIAVPCASRNLAKYSTQGTVALDDRGAKAHLVDPLLVGERLGNVIADALASVVGRAERGGAVHAVVGVQGHHRLDVVGLPGDGPGRRPSACRLLGVHRPPPWLAIGLTVNDCQVVAFLHDVPP